LAVLAAAFLADGTGPAADRADPPGRPPAHLLARGLSFIGEVAVAELWVFSVRVEQGIGPVRLGEFGIGDRALEPPVVRLTSYSKYPTRHRDGDAVSGELAHERVPPFPGRFAWDRYAAARRRTSFSCSNSRTRRLASRSSWDSADVVPGLIPASTSALRIHFCNVRRWIPKSAAICSRVTPSSRFGEARTTSSRNSLGEGLGRTTSFQAAAAGQARSDVTYSCISPNPRRRWLAHPWPRQRSGQDRRSSEVSWLEARLHLPAFGCRRILPAFLHRAPVRREGSHRSGVPRSSQ